MLFLLNSFLENKTVKLESYTKINAKYMEVQSLLQLCSRVQCHLTCS